MKCVRGRGDGGCLNEEGKTLMENNKQWYDALSLYVDAINSLSLYWSIWMAIKSFIFVFQPLHSRNQQLPVAVVSVCVRECVLGIEHGHPIHHFSLSRRRWVSLVFKLKRNNQSYYNFHSIPFSSLRFSLSFLHPIVFLLGIFSLNEATH